MKGYDLSPQLPGPITLLYRDGLEALKYLSCKSPLGTAYVPRPLYGAHGRKTASHYRLFLCNSHLELAGAYLHSLGFSALTIL